MGTLEYSCVTSNTGGFFCFNSTVSYTCLLLTQSIHFIETTQNNVMLCYIIYSNLWSDVVEWSKALYLRLKRLVLQCINGVSSNPIDGRKTN